MSTLKVVIVVTDKPEVDRIDVKESDGEGNYTALEHPWRQKDLAKVQKAKVAPSLLAQGISDTKDVLRIVNKPQRSRRHSGKTPVALNGLSSTK